MLKKILLMVFMLAPLSLLAQKFAHFNSNEVLAAYPAAKTVQTELENLGKQYQSDLEAMQKELQAKAQKFQAEVTEKTPENMKQRRVQELQELEQRIQQAYTDNQDSFRKAQVEKMQPIQEAVFNALTAVLKDGGYVYAVDKAVVAGVTINETLSTDITAQVKAKLGIK